MTTGLMHWVVHHYTFMQGGWLDRACGSLAQLSTAFHGLLRLAAASCGLFINGIECCGTPFPRSRTLPVDSVALQSARFLDHLQFSCTLHI